MSDIDTIARQFIEALPHSHALGMRLESISEGAAGQTVTATALIGAIAAPSIPLLTRRIDRKHVMLALTTLLGFVVGPWAVGALSEWFGEGNLSLRYALSIIIPTGIVGALLAFLGVRHLEADRVSLANGESADDGQ